MLQQMWTRLEACWEGTSQALSELPLLQVGRWGQASHRLSSLRYIMGSGVRLLLLSVLRHLSSERDTLMHQMRVLMDAPLRPPSLQMSVLSHHRMGFSEGRGCVLQALRPYLDAAGGTSEEMPLMSEPQVGFRRLDESLHVMRSRLVFGIGT